MKDELVHRYTCDFCHKKRYYSKGAMTIHERHCTCNPGRICRVCGMLDQEQPKMQDLLDAVMPVPVYYIDGLEEVCFDCDEMSKAWWIERLRDVSGNCPACIMAALRQKGIPVGAVHSFNFTDEMKAIWDEINDAKREKMLYKPEW